MGLEMETHRIKTQTYSVTVTGLRNHLRTQTALIPMNTFRNPSVPPSLADQEKKAEKQDLAFLIFLTESNGSHQERFSDLSEVIPGLLVNL